MSNQTKQSGFRMPVRALCEGAAFVACAQLLSYLKLFRLPYGGSFTLTMLPIFLYCFRWGLPHGLIASFVLSLLQLTDTGFVIAWQSLLGDYVFSYTLLGLAGLFHGRKHGLVLGSLLGALGQFLSCFVTGATIWKEYMPESFLGLSMVSPWIYSALYNGLFVGFNLAAVLLVEALLWKPLKHYLTAEDLR